MAIASNQQKRRTSMKKNVGSADRVVRVVAALVLAFLLLNGTISGTIGTILAIVAILLIGTSAVSVCPIYSVLGLSTRKKGESTKASA
jgi:hypothetical protein